MNKHKETLILAKNDLMLDEEFKLEIKKMKIKAASISFKTKTIRINKDFIDGDDELIKYLIYHELVHYKLRSKDHGKSFYNILYSKLGEDFVKRQEKKTMEKLLKLNGFHI
jgi:predicted metal-dependent hydrolase